MASYPVTVNSSANCCSYDKPWTTQKDPKEKWEKIIFWVSILIGLAIGALICFLAWKSVTDNEVCALLLHNFQH
jgi:hypothetical protein